MSEINHNPDILSCLANLSNDEVFTPPEIANAMLDMIPSDFWKNPNVKVFDPSCKSGVFLREAAKRFLKGLEEKMPDLQERIDHIFKRMLFGFSITELTAQLSRRSLYCSKTANGHYSITTFKTDHGNILFDKINHTWKNGKCIYCGASEDIYNREEGKETHAYQFIHLKEEKIKELEKMRFDLIISNPPYQLNVGVEKDNYSIPIYQKFVEQSKKLNPRYLVMIIPSRWFAGGRGLDEFRETMLHDKRINIIHDFPDANDIFPGVQIKAGVCYFLWSRDQKGDCSVTTHLNNKEIGPMVRPLLEEGNETFIRYNQAISIIRKVCLPNMVSFSRLVSTQTPFGLLTSYKGNKIKTQQTDIKLYISGNEKEYKGSSSFAHLADISRGQNMIPWHKVYIAKAGSGSDSFPHLILSKPFYGEPNTCCNQSYLVIGPFKDKKECENVMSYISTKFFRFMVLQRKNSQDAMRQVYQFVPMQDFSKPWSDAELYKKYNLTNDEITFIESMIKPMDFEGDKDE